MANLQQIKETIVKIECGGKEGTAFLINKNTAITATHCILAALEDNTTEIFLTFSNVNGREPFTQTASVYICEESTYPISILKLEEEVESEYLKLVFYEDNLPRNEKLWSYGYPKVKRQEGYPVDLYVNDYLNDNQPYDYDISLVVDSKNKLSDYSGMSGSPLIYRNEIIGVLDTEGLETNGERTQAIDIGVVSNKKMLDIYQLAGIDISERQYEKIALITQECKEPKVFDDTVRGIDNEQKNYNEKYVIQSAYDEIKEELDATRKEKIEFIYQLKREGKQDKAWKELLKFTEQVRCTKEKDKNFLAKLYYIRALWYLEDKNDCQNAQKYLSKVLNNCPDYDCRTYYARKYYLEGNVLEEKRVLLPIDNKAVLNTYIQLCVQKLEMEEAIIEYQKHQELSDDTTNYLMSLVYILDHDYDMAESFLNKALASYENSPIYTLMKGVVRFWKILPSNISDNGDILPVMYNMDVLLDEKSIQEIQDITKLYEKAQVLAQVADNEEVEKEILCVWLNTLSISSLLQKEARDVVEKIKAINPYQFQAIVYLYKQGERFEEYEVENIKANIKKVRNPIETVLACVYIALGKNNKKEAYALLRQYKYEFERKDMLGMWFELAEKSCKIEEQQHLYDMLKDSSLDDVEKMRLRGIQLEVIGEEQELLSHAHETYQHTKHEIDLVNLISCYEKFHKWEDVEKYSLEWKQSFLNPLAEIRYVRALAMQNRQKECLQHIEELRRQGKLECITNEVRFFESQALKLLGHMEEAIEIARELWEKTNNSNTLFLLAECYFLNGQIQDTVFALKEGMRKGIRTVLLYQKLAEYEKIISTKEATRYAKKACHISENDPKILTWAMNFLYGIGESKEANEIFAKLRAMDGINCFQTVSFKEIRKILEEAERENEKRYNEYKGIGMPYHVYIDSMKSSSYVLYCTQIWNHNKNHEEKVSLFTNFGGRPVLSEPCKEITSKSVAIDFSSLLLMWHLGLWDEMKQCWKHIYISSDINRMISLEIAKCMPNQPDVIEQNKTIMDTWRQKELAIVPLPTKEEIEVMQKKELQISDTVFYEIAKKNNLIWIEDNLITDLMEESHKVPEEMRLAVVSTYELLSALEERGEIEIEFKERYSEGKKKIRKEIVESLVSHEGKLPILVDENFLREIYEMEGTNIITRGCQIHVLENVFQSVENEQKKIDDAAQARKTLKEIQYAIQEAKEEGIFEFCECYSREERDANAIHTAMLLDLIQCSIEQDAILLCDDRMINGYDKMGDSLILNSVDALTLMKKKNLITNERYLNIITTLLQEGYSFIVPPYSYMKSLLLQTENSGICLENLSKELKQVGDYLTQICPAERERLSTEVYAGKLPEAVLFMYYLQKVFMDLLLTIWKSDRNNEWKRDISNWLMINFSEFGYDFYFFEELSEEKLHYRSLQLANFLLSGFQYNYDNKYQKQYYDWLFGWLKPYFDMEEGMEEKTINVLADFLFDFYQTKSQDVSLEIGIGAILQLTLDNIPEYYADKIRTHAKIAPLIDRFECNLIILDRKNIIEQAVFYDWIESATKSGINEGYKCKRDETEYEITWIIDDILQQAYEITWMDNHHEQHKVRYKIEGAMLGCRDKLLRMKGFWGITQYLDSSHIQQYEKEIECIHKRQSTIEQIVAEVKSNAEYRKHIISTFVTQKSVEIYELEDLLPSDVEYFESAKMDYSQEYYEDKMQWCQTKLDKTKNPEILLHILDLKLEHHADDAEKVFLKLIDERNIIWFNLYIELIKYFFGQMMLKPNYGSRGIQKSIQWSHYYAGEVLNIIDECKADENQLYNMFEKRNRGTQEVLTMEQDVSLPYGLSYARMIDKPLCKILNRHKDNYISQPLVEQWVEGLEAKIRTDFKTFEEAILLNPDSNAVPNHYMAGNLLDEINLLKVKYNICIEQPKETYVSFMQEITAAAEQLTENHFFVLAILSVNPFPTEWMEEIKRVIRLFPGEQSDDEAYRIAKFICIILRRLDKDFVKEYISILKQWVKEQFVQKRGANQRELIIIMEHLCILEKSENLVESYIDFWGEIAETEISVCPEIVELLKRLTLIIPISQVKKLRKVISNLKVERVVESVD